MKSFKTVLRLLLGAILLFSGLNFFFQWMPIPEMPEAATDLLGAIFASGFTLEFMSAIFILVGLMLITNFYSAFGLVLVAPFTLYITLFHIFLAPGQILMGLVMFLLNIIVAFEYKAAYAPMFKRR